MQELKNEFRENMQRLHGWRFEKEESAGLEKISKRVFLFHDVPKLHFRIPLEEIVKKIAENAFTKKIVANRLEAKRLVNRARKYSQKEIMETLEKNKTARSKLLEEIHAEILPVAEEYCRKIMEARGEEETREAQIRLEDVLEGKTRYVKLEIGVPKTPKDG